VRGAAIWALGRLDPSRLREIAAASRAVDNDPMVEAEWRAELAEARDLLGGNGILLENHVIRHMADIESIHTYEGTETMQTLIVGRDITGVSAFV